MQNVCVVNNVQACAGSDCPKGSYCHPITLQCVKALPLVPPFYILTPYLYIPIHTHTYSHILTYFIHHTHTILIHTHSYSDHILSYIHHRIYLTEKTAGLELRGPVQLDERQGTIHCRQTEYVRQLCLRLLLEQGRSHGNLQVSVLRGRPRSLWRTRSSHLCSYTCLQVPHYHRSVL